MQFYRGLNQERERCDDDQPDNEESKTFLREIWSELVDHNNDEKWQKDLQSKVSVLSLNKVK